MKLMTIVGARPQFVKAGALSRVLRDYPTIQEVLVHTGQHYDPGMSEVFFQEMEIPSPDHSLSMGNLSHAAMTGRMMEALESLILQERPDHVLVYGDTNSTLAGALAAKKLLCPVIHVEAGLRSHNMAMPEEINRILTDRISDLLFCPTQQAEDNLVAEGFHNFACRVIRSGDVMEDAARFYSARIGQDKSLLQTLGLKEGHYVIATLHRQENVDDPIVLGRICAALDEVHAQWPVILPLHPRTRARMVAMGVTTQAHLMDPVGYFDMIRLVRDARLVLTDSGGLQKEAYFFRKFCVTLRPETEWVELVDHGYNAIAGSDQQKIADAVERLSQKEWPEGEELYGGGTACRMIAETLTAL